jgi:hypothetical protein
MISNTNLWTFGNFLPGNNVHYPRRFEFSATSLSESQQTTSHVMCMTYLLSRAGKLIFITRTSLQKIIRLTHQRCPRCNVWMHLRARKIEPPPPPFQGCSFKPSVTEGLIQRTVVIFNFIYTMNIASSTRQTFYHKKKYSRFSLQLYR